MPRPTSIKKVLRGSSDSSEVHQLASQLAATGLGAAPTLPASVNPLPREYASGNASDFHQGYHQSRSSTREHGLGPQATRQQPAIPYDPFAPDSQNLPQPSGDKQKSHGSKTDTTASLIPVAELDSSGGFGKKTQLLLPQIGTQSPAPESYGYGYGYSAGHPGISTGYGLDPVLESTIQDDKEERLEPSKLTEPTKPSHQSSQAKQAAKASSGASSMIQLPFAPPSRRRHDSPGGEKKAEPSKKRRTKKP